MNEDLKTYFMRGLEPEVHGFAPVLFVEGWFHRNGDDLDFVYGFPPRKLRVAGDDVACVQMGDKNETDMIYLKSGGTVSVHAWEHEDDKPEA